jgi:glycosyltransferase involved in cell wall biosynthesis/ubiquinone/menaquinone biosynthesis C-methylase UbiE
MTNPAELTYLYVAETDATCAFSDDRLAPTTERHKIALNVANPPASTGLEAALRAHPLVAGVVFELKRGWAGQSRIRWAHRLLGRGHRVWWYWPAEQVVECLNRGRLASDWRHLAIVGTYFKLVEPLLDMKTRFRSGARWIIRGRLPPEEPPAPRVMVDLAARLASVRPVPLGKAGMVRGVYLRTDFWAPITSGGSYGHTCYVAKELNAGGPLVCLMAQRYPLLDDLGVQQVVLTPPPTQSVSENDIVRATAHYDPIVRAAVEVIQPDYIYERLCLGNYAGAALSQDLGIPYIAEYNGSELSMRRSFDGEAYLHESVYLKAEELAFAQATAISVVSEEIRSSLVARGVAAEKILVNPNGVDPDVYRPAAADERDEVRRELGFAGDDRVIGFSGTFGGWHGVDVLAAALPTILARAPNARFLLIGDGNYKHLVDEVVARDGLAAKVRSVGRVPQMEGARLLRACDLFVSPHSSHMVDSKFFGSPTKIFEYMAMGRGIVASDLEQIGQVLSPALRPADIARGAGVGEHRSVLCTPGDVAEFADGVIALVERPDVAAALGRNAREAACRCHSWARHVELLRTFATARGSGALKAIRTPSVPVADAYKDEIQRQWDNDPAGSHYVKDAEPHTLAWFLEAEAYRYEQYAPWMARTMEFAGHPGERLLEIGGGMGTDLVQFARQGSITTDLDLSSGHLELARENFRLRGLTGEFVLHDAERLPFDDDTFDVVYSNGVLHHTPDTRGVVNEIWRVLKPGGKAIVMMYAENSLHYWRNLVWAIGLKEHQLLQHSMGEIMSRAVERSDNASARPLVKVYTKKRLRRLFGAFDAIEIVQRQMVPAEVPRLLARIPVAALGTVMGWNLVIKARKPLRANGVTGVREAGHAETMTASAHR